MNLKQRKRVRIYLFIAVIIMMALLVAKLSIADDWKYFEAKTEQGMPYVFAVIMDSNKNKLAISAYHAEFEENEFIRKYAPFTKVGVHFVPSLSKGYAVSPLHPWIRIDGKDYNYITDQELEFKSGMRGFTIKTTDVNGTWLNTLRNAGRFRIDYLIFLNIEDHAEFALPGIREVIDKLIKDAEDKHAVFSLKRKSKKPAHIKP